MRNTVLFFALAALALTVGAPASADEAADQIKAFKEQMTSADEAGKVRLIQELAASGNKGASKAISPYMTKGSTAVRVAAIKAIGSLKEKSQFGKLMGFLKAFDKDPKLLAAALDAVGNYGSPGSLKPVTKLAKKWLFKDSEVASAAARAIGRIPNKTAVDTLIDLLDLTFPKQSASGPSVSQETRALLEKSRPAIMSGLQFLTGWDFTDPAAWKRFWDKFGKRWKPADSEPDFTKIKTWEDPGYGFKITRVADRWELARGRDVGDDYKDYRVCLRHSTEGMLVASVYVYATENIWSYTAQSRADLSKDSYHERYQDIKEESWKEVDVKRNGVSGVSQSFTGMDSAKNVCRVHNLYFVNGPMVYIVYGWLRTGSAAEIGEELESILKSFEFTD